MVRTTAKLLTLVAGLTLSGQAFAQASDSETTNASVTLAQAIDVTENTALQFGNVAKGTTGSNTVTINATSGARTLGGGGNAALVTGTTATRAAYTVTGQADATFSITITDNTIDLTGPGSGSLALTLNSSAATGTLTAGTATFGIGGVLTIDNTDADDVAGAYTGTFEVTTAYN